MQKLINSGGDISAIIAIQQQWRSGETLLWLRVGIE